MNQSTANRGNNQDVINAPQPEPAIELTGLRFTWPRDKAPTLAIEVLSVARGERLFIAGPSGSGKSSLLGVLAGVLVPQKGVVKSLSNNLASINSAERDRFRADHVGYVFQMFNLIPYLSVIENVILPCRFSKLRKEKALRSKKTVEAEALRLLAHLGLNGKTLLSQPVAELSVGQQQRVAAARALIGSPEIIIADEPTSALDSNHRKKFIRLLLQEGKQSDSTIVFVSHDLSLAPYFDKTIKMTEINGVPSTPEA